jgi:aldose 1-epimerase
VTSPPQQQQQQPLLLRTSEASATVVPGVGGRLVSWTTGSTELLAARSDHPAEHGCYPMAPWPGRLRGNEVLTADGPVVLPASYREWAIHGTVWTAAFELVHRTESGAWLQAPLGPSWPWPGSVLLSWELDGPSLTSVLEVVADEAAGPDGFPAEVGWHPWFRRRLDLGGPAEVSFDAVAMLERGPDHLPTGRHLPPTGAGPFDDAFAVPDGRASIRWPGAGRLDVASSATWVVLFDELDDFVCLEPQTGPPDGLGAAAGRARPGSPRSATATWTYTPDP